MLQEDLINETTVMSVLLVPQGHKICAKTLNVMYSFAKIHAFFSENSQKGW